MQNKVLDIYIAKKQLDSCSTKRNKQERGAIVKAQIAMEIANVYVKNWTWYNKKSECKQSEPKNCYVYL